MGDAYLVAAASPADRPDIRAILEMAGLDVPTLHAELEADRVLVARRDSDGPVIGAAICPESIPPADLPDDGYPGPPPGAHLVAIAVRPGIRSTGVGTALVEAAARRWGRISAAFPPDVGRFYESLDFEILATLGDGRRFGIRVEAG